MGTIIQLTEDWTSVAGPLVTPVAQPTYSALDVSAFDILDLMVTTGVSGTGTQTITLQLITGMSLYSETAWAVIPNTIVTKILKGTGAVPSIIQLPTLTGGFYRYIRWQVTALTNITSVRFLIEGIGRTYGGV